MDYVEFTKRRKINLVIIRDDSSVPLNIFDVEDGYEYTMITDAMIRFNGDDVMYMIGGTYVALRFGFPEYTDYQLYIRDIGDIFKTEDELKRAGIWDFFDKPLFIKEDR